MHYTDRQGNLRQRELITSRAKGPHICSDGSARGNLLIMELAMREHGMETTIACYGVEDDVIHEL